MRGVRCLRPAQQHQPVQGVETFPPYFTLDTTTVVAPVKCARFGYSQNTPKQSRPFRLAYNIANTNVMACGWYRLRGTQPRSAKTSHIASPKHFRDVRSPTKIDHSDYWHASDTPPPRPSHSWMVPTAAQHNTVFSRRDTVNNKMGQSRSLERKTRFFLPSDGSFPTDAVALHYLTTTTTTTTPFFLPHFFSPPLLPLLQYAYLV